MPIIPYTASNFPRSMSTSLHGTHSLSVSWNDLIWSAISVGKRGIDDMLAHGSYSIDEILFRNYILWANLWEESDLIYRSPVYDDLDPTEKGSISYFLGMAIAKLFASSLLFAPWMVHLDRLVDRHTVGLIGRSRPDLVGQDSSGRWILVEGKGRSGGYSKLALDQAKAQVRQVLHIDGVSPYLRVGAEMCFEDHLTMYLDDPESPFQDSVDLEIGSGSLREIYYKRFLPLLSVRTRTQILEDRKYATVDYDSIGVSVGVWEDIEKLVTSEAPMLASELDLEQPRVAKGEDTDLWIYQIYPDGIAVGIDERWSDDSMKLMPLER